jgi:hypothetical protein
VIVSKFVSYSAVQTTEEFSRAFSKRKIANLEGKTFIGLALSVAEANLNSKGSLVIRS